MKDKMTWEQTIKHIRTQEQFKTLVETAYFEEDLLLNVERFKKSKEFIETLKLLEIYTLNVKNILDIGSGNGISAVSFALLGYNVIAVEPNPSKTIGAGAIQQLKDYYNLDNLTIQESFAEDINFPDENFDMVYARQCMHHAYDLEKFIAECSRVLKKNGVLITIRDHVVFDEKDKQWFLEIHPLHKFYGGENAFSAKEYKDAMQKVGLKIELELKYFDSIINLFPLDKSKHINTILSNRKKVLKNKIGFIASIPFIFSLYNNYLNKKVGSIFDERLVAGRMYSYIAIKK